MRFIDSRLETQLLNDAFGITSHHSVIPISQQPFLSILQSYPDMQIE